MFSGGELPLGVFHQVVEEDAPHPPPLLPAGQVEVLIAPLLEARVGPTAVLVADPLPVCVEVPCVLPVEVCGGQIATSTIPCAPSHLESYTRLGRAEYTKS